ncbi:MFS transporter [Sphingomonas sp.]|jgi:MFS family permease|uniref:MFS transporter n=1 Tax=Sphingomonas sp. TaxID=28214 RepID=UPI002ED82D8F
MSEERGEFSRGWRVLAASFGGIALGVSSLYFYSLGIFIKPMAAEFGWGRGAASLGALVGTAGAALMSIPMGRLTDRIGSVRVAIGSLAMLALGFAALGAFTTSLAAFLLLTAAVSLLTAGSSPMPFSRLVVAVFNRNRGLALGLTLAGTGLGAILIPRLLVPFVAEHGWRAGYFVLAGVIAVASPFLLLLLRGVQEPPRDYAPAPSLAAILADPAYRLLALMFLLAATAILGTVVHFVPMMGDWGLTPVAAGGMTALIGVAAIFGRLVTGWLLDRLPPALVTAAVFLLAAGGMTLLASGGLAVAIPGALITGLALGAEVDLIAFLVARLFPRPVYGTMYGAVYTAFLVGGAAGPAISGYLQQATGSYRLSLFVAAGLLVLAAGLAVRLSQLPEKTPGNS